MKKISLILILLLAVFLGACEKDKENIIINESISANDLNPLSAATFVLIRDDADLVFQAFTWTGVDYGFTASVTYTVQFDLKANNFSSATDLISVSHVKTASVKVGDLNKLMLAAELDPDVAVELQFRVKAVINTAVDPVYSSVEEAMVTPYATSFPPIYMCGAATGGWSWDLYVYKEVRSTAPNVYETIAHFLNGETFRFFADIGWGAASYNYPYYTGTVSSEFENALDGDLNLRFIGTTGYYKITVNMSTKSVAMEAVADQGMYMTGAAVGGWDWTTNYVTMTWKSNGIWQATTDFINNEVFRFFAQADWGPTSYNYPYFAEGTVSALFEDALDGDNNFKFIGTTGDFVITLNLIDKIVTMETP